MANSNKKECKFKISFNNWMDYNYTNSTKSLVNFFMKDSMLYMHYTSDNDLSSCVQPRYEIYDNAASETSKYALYIPYSLSSSKTLSNGLPDCVSSFDKVENIPIKIRRDSDVSYTSSDLTLFGDSCTATIDSNYRSNYLRPDSSDVEFVNGVCKIKLNLPSVYPKYDFSLKSDSFYLSTKPVEQESSIEDSLQDQEESTSTDDSEQPQENSDSLSVDSTTSSENQDFEVYYKIGICPLKSPIFIDGMTTLSQPTSALQDEISNHDNSINNIKMALASSDVRLAAGFFNDDSNDTSSYVYYLYIANKDELSLEYNSNHRFIHCDFGTNIFSNICTRAIIPLIESSDLSGDKIIALLYFELYDSSTGLPFIKNESDDLLFVKVLEDGVKKNASILTTDFGGKENNIAALSLSVISGD